VPGPGVGHLGLREVLVEVGWREGWGRPYESIDLRHCSPVALRPIEMWTGQEVCVLRGERSQMKLSRCSVKS
jgi:hypothetical protein